MQPEQPSAPVLAIEDPRIQAENYNAIISTVRPHDVSVVASQFEVHDRLAGLLTPRANGSVPQILSSAPVAGTGRLMFTIEQTIEFTIVDSGDLIASRGIARIQVRLSVEGDPPPPFWELFLRRNVPLYVQPVLRDLLSTLCMRANLMCEALPSTMVTPAIKAALPSVTKA